MKGIRIILLAFCLFALLPASKNIPTYTFADLTGKIQPASHPEFVLVSNQYSIKTTYVRKETYDAFKQMAQEARKAGINLTIVSGTRTYSRQIEIWEEKWNRFTGSDEEKAQEILEYSSMPGTSRHHWGTDIDINSTEVAYFDSGQGAKEYAWLAENAHRFGFFQPYVKKGNERKAGYKEEKWHWSYYPIADQMMRAYKRLVTYEYITGFSGSELAPDLRVIEHFVEGISDQFEPFETPALTTQGAE